MDNLFTVVETPTYLRTASAFWDDAQRMEFVNFIAECPDAGVVIPGTDSLRKVRWAASGRGKSGGARVIYFNRLERGEVRLVIAYIKGKFDNLPTDFLNRLKEQYDV
jgi:hypothetical protein